MTNPFDVPLVTVPRARDGLLGLACMRWRNLRIGFAAAAQCRALPVLQQTAENGNRTVLEVDGFVLQPEHLSMSKDELSVQLTALEFKLLYQLTSKPKDVFSRTELQELVWGGGHGNTERAVDVLVNRLRSKLDTLPGGEDIVKTVRGIGYHFSA